MGLFDRARAGDQWALARLATLIENDRPDAVAALDALGAPQRPLHVIGVTGPPGAGKSSLINHLLTELRKEGTRIAVLLVDPSSQATGGAVLGDRVRMLAWGDPDVFVRSQATRGQEGGLAPSTATLIDLFAHMDFETVLIETVGVGQDGIDIRAVCDTTIVVQAPNLGDSIQALKAGILEIADIFVVTKSDLPGAHQVVRDLNAMLHLIGTGEQNWPVPVVAVSSTEETGFETLGAKITSHRSHIGCQTAPDRRAARMRWEIAKRATARLAATARRLPPEAWTASGSRDDRTRALLQATLDEYE
ncbi:MAG TPA: methylmalonyl Co-A mutase-associated GTPase MeaB [Thermomicrobiales bacterium]|nr:methylmalonyl Co-A mutase-associated GTPase MeaB [Thermomicrobiales bacterium]